MTVTQIPVNQKLPWFQFKVMLSSVRYTLEMRFNPRMNRWILSIYDVSQTPILMGIPLLINRSLIGQYPTLNLPPGDMFVVDQSGQNTQPTLSSFCVDHALLYVSP